MTLKRSERILALALLCTLAWGQRTTGPARRGSTTVTTPTGPAPAVNSGPGVCGDTTHVAQITSNAQGQVTNCVPVAVTGGGGSSLTTPSTTTVNNVPQYSTTNGTALSTGLGIVTTLGSPGLDTNLATEKAVRTAIAGLGGGGGTITFDGRTGSTITFLSTDVPVGPSGLLDCTTSGYCDLTALVPTKSAANVMGGQNVINGGTGPVVANSGTTGTTLYTLTKLTGEPSTAVIAATSDTSGIVGIAAAGTFGTSGTVSLVSTGTTSCAFDGATTSGDYIQISATIAGDCHDAGSTRPTSGQIIGRVLSTNASSGTYGVIVEQDQIPGAGSSTAVSGPYLNVGGISYLPFDQMYPATIDNFSSGWTKLMSTPSNLTVSAQTAGDAILTETASSYGYIQKAGTTSIEISYSNLFGTTTLQNYDTIGIYAINGTTDLKICGEQNTPNGPVLLTLTAAYNGVGVTPSAPTNPAPTSIWGESSMGHLRLVLSGSTISCYNNATGTVPFQTITGVGTVTTFGIFMGSTSARISSAKVN